MALLPILLAAGMLPAQSNNGWCEPTSAIRLVFDRPLLEDFCLLSAPVGSTDVPVTGCRAYSGSASLPVRLVWADASNVWFLVKCQDVPQKQEITLYLLPNATPQTAADEGVDPWPVHLYAQRTAGQDLPMSWEQLQMLDTRVDAKPSVRDLLTFMAEYSASENWWYHGDWQRKNHLFQFSTWLLVPARGRYVFVMKTPHPAGLMLDGELALEHHANQAVERQTTRPLALAPGLHRLVARGVTRTELHFAAAWEREGGAEASDVVAITGGELTRGRIERRERRLHAFGVATTAPAYTFEGTTNVFMPVRLESRSVSWDDEPLACVWRFQGRDLGTGRVCRAVLPAVSGVRDIELNVTDKQGHSAQDRIPVSCDGMARAQYRVSVRLVGVPAAGYEEDVVRPEIHVRATSPDSVDFTVEATIERAGGGSTNLSEVVAIEKSWGRMVLPADTAGVYRRIAWRLRHGTVELDSGALLFDHAPFHMLPDALDGDMLCARSNALMLVARRASAGEPPPFAGAHPGQRVLLLDGFLATSMAGGTNLAATLDKALRSTDDDGGATGATNICYQRVDLQAMERIGSDAGNARLLLLAQAGALLPADVVVLAPACDALGQGERLAQFERRLAALAGLLAGHAGVVMVTPPPFAILPGCEAMAESGTPVPDARQLAELISRVADANGLTVVDLYTGFMTAENRAALICCDTLTAAGMARAVELLRRTLYGRTP